MRIFIICFFSVFLGFHHLPMRGLFNRYCFRAFLQQRSEYFPDRQKNIFKQRDIFGNVCLNIREQRCIEIVYKLLSLVNTFANVASCVCSVILVSFLCEFFNIQNTCSLLFICIYNYVCDTYISL